MTDIPEGCVNVQQLYNSNTGSVVDRPKWMLPNSTIVLAGGVLSAQIVSRCGTLALFFKSCFNPV